MNDTDPLEDNRISKFKVENRQLRQNFDNVRELYDELEIKYNQLSQKFKDLEQEKMEQEHHHQQVVEDCRNQLQQKVNELEELRIQLPQPLDMDLVKLQCLSTLRAENFPTVELLKDEVKKWRDLYNGVRKDHEEFKVMLIDKEKCYQSFIENLHEEQAEERILWTSRLREKNEALDAQTELVNMATSLQRQSGELQLKIKSITSELEDSRTSFGESLQLKESEIQDLKRQASNAKLVLESAVADKESMRASLAGIQDDLRNEKRKYDEILHEKEKLIDRLKEATLLSDQISHAHKTEISSLKLSFEKEKAEYVQKLSVSERKTKDLEAEIEKTMMSAEDFKQRLKSKEQENIDRLRAVENSYLVRLRDLEFQIKSLQEQLSLSESEKEKAFDLMKLEKAELLNSNAALKSELQKLTNQFKKVESDVERKASENDTLLKEHREVVRRSSILENKENMLIQSSNVREKKLSEAFVQIESLAHENSLLKSTITELRSSLENSRQSYDFNIKDLKEKLHEAEDKLLKQKQEYDNLSKKLQEERNHSDNEVKALRTSFKEKLKQFRNTYDQLLSEYNVLKEEKDNLKRKLDNENDSAKILLRNEMNKQQKILALLKQEGIFK